jgi:enoyl-[acyl-carrier protein] reductase III
MILKGKIALVTGSSRGIGRATALELGREGADVVVNFRKQADKAQQVVDELKEMGRRAIAVQANVGEPEELKYLFDIAAREMGGLDVFVANAAAGESAPVLQNTIKGWERAMNVNARAFLLGTQMAVPLMQARGGGRIIAITSPGDVRYFPDYAVVGASKGALNALVRSIAVEMGPLHITTNAVSPAAIDTESLRYYRRGLEMQQKAKDLTPTGRVVEPEDVANLVAFLASDKSAMINGQVITIDGGYFNLM